jgi:hypothetical protein
MKRLISNYIFDASARTVQFVDFTSVDLESLLLITNVTDNKIIYNFANPSRGGGVNGNTVTLVYDTTSMSDTDALQIYYDDGKEAASETSILALEDILDYLKVLVSNTKVLATQDTLQRQRVVVEGTVGVNGTVTTNATYGEITNRQEMARLEFANGIRSNLIF